MAFVAEGGLEMARRRHKPEEIVAKLRQVDVLEAFNGWGYFAHHVHSAYLWSFSKHHQAGKYVSDRKCSATASDKQCGTMPILKVMMALDKTIKPARLGT